MADAEADHAEGPPRARREMVDEVARQIPNLGIDLENTTRLTRRQHVELCFERHARRPVITGIDANTTVGLSTLPLNAVPIIGVASDRRVPARCWKGTLFAPPRRAPSPSARLRPSPPLFAALELVCCSSISSPSFPVLGLPYASSVTASSAPHREGDDLHTRSCVIDVSISAERWEVNAAPIA